MGIADGDSQRRKKRTTLRPLEMFLLELVRGGLITPYDWQAKGRVSLGASLPAARRLVKEGLLRKVKKGPHGRHEFGLTDKSWDELDDLERYVKDASDQPFGDLESVVRLACLAMMLNKTGIAKKLLLEASEEHRHRARLARKRAASRAAFKSRLGGLYSMVLARCEAEQEICIANQLERLHRDWDSLTQEILELWEPEDKDQDEDDPETPR
jgi:DNA-binding PadR family transcriptional regulator